MAQSLAHLRIWKEAEVRVLSRARRDEGGDKVPAVGRLEIDFRDMPPWMTFYGKDRGDQITTGLDGRSRYLRLGGTGPVRLSMRCRRGDSTGGWCSEQSLVRLWLKGL